jgi:formate-nitrite transporter family protein
VEVLYVAVTSGAVGWMDYFGHFLLPALAGNIVGGVSLVALFDHAQVVAERPAE